MNFRRIDIGIVPERTFVDGTDVDVAYSEFWTRPCYREETEMKKKKEAR